jgi:UDPglucose--hexose-1-phosphate uridylyltransferase
MPELRQDPSTKQWVIIATERAKRPEDYPKHSERAEHPEYSESCPFCSGNEAMTPPEEFAYRIEGTEPNTEGWWVRVVPNKFAALVPNGHLGRISENGFFRRMEGVGKHEVVIESPIHNATIGTMDLRQVEEVLLIYRDRFNELSQEPRFQFVTIFRNHGRLAGTSLVHPHSQMIATPIVPLHIRHRLAEAMRYYDDHGKCVFCTMLAEEIDLQKRVVLETEGFVAFEAFASSAPFETWIMPKKHAATYGSISTDDAKEFAAVLIRVMKRIYIGLNDPDYNYMIHTAPFKDADENWYHWFVQIVPRLTMIAGFELGSRVFVNTTPPEAAAEFLRQEI